MGSEMCIRDRITQEYGANPSAINGPAGHSGRDYGVVTGTPVVSLVDGVVRWADWCHKLPGGPNGWEQRWFLSLSYGGIVTVIEHDDCLAVTAHLSRTDLNPGQHVAKGEIIGYSGATGLGTGPHAHTEIIPVSYTHLTLPTTSRRCRSRWSPYH